MRGCKPSHIAKRMAGSSPATDEARAETLKNKGENTMYTIIYKWNGFTITEKRNGLCYAVMLAERHNGVVYRNGVKVWG